MAGAVETPDSNSLATVKTIRSLQLGALYSFGEPTGETASSVSEPKIGHFETRSNDTLDVLLLNILSNELPADLYGSAEGLITACLVLPPILTID
jgi:hypothetical protein